MKILVTGGTGYIGSHTVVELQQKGYDVVIVDNLSKSNTKMLDNITAITGKKPAFYELELCDENAVTTFFNEVNGIDAAIHFAAFKAVGESVADPLLYYKNNLFSLVNLLQAMRKHNINDIVFSSSCTVYGQAEQLPVTEQSALQKAESPYGNTKQVSEDILTDSCKAYSLNAIALRYFNPIGAHPSTMIGELPIDVPSNLVPYITQTAIGKRDFLSVYGGDYNTPDGTAIRDYIHVVDLAKAHVIAIERLLHKKQKQNLEIFNLGTGVGSSVLDAVKAFEKATAVKVNYKIVPRRSGDIEASYADTSFANGELGWKTEYTLEDAMLHQWNWEKKLAGK